MRCGTHACVDCICWVHDTCFTYMLVVRAKAAIMRAREMAAVEHRTMKTCSDTHTHTSKPMHTNESTRGRPCLISCVHRAMCVCVCVCVRVCVTYHENHELACHVLEPNEPVHSEREHDRNDRLGQTLNHGLGEVVGRTVVPASQRYTHRADSFTCKQCLTQGSKT